MKIYQIDWTAGTEYVDNFGAVWRVDLLEETLKTKDGETLESLYTMKEAIRDLEFTQKEYVSYQAAYQECLDKGITFVSVGGDLKMYRDGYDKVFLKFELTADMVSVELEHSEWDVW